jgi:hypothetical protein
MNLIRHALPVMLFLAMEAKIAMAGRTQVVLQWLDAGRGSMDLRDIKNVEDALESVSSGRFIVDGHDVGSSTVNVFLYADGSKVDAAILVVTRLFERGKLPREMRIGRAIYDVAKASATARR